MKDVKEELLVGRRKPKNAKQNKKRKLNRLNKIEQSKKLLELMTKKKVQGLVERPKAK